MVGSKKAVSFACLVTSACWHCTALHRKMATKEQTAHKGSPFWEIFSSIARNWAALVEVEEDSRADLAC